MFYNWSNKLGELNFEAEFYVQYFSVYLVSASVH